MRARYMLFIAVFCLLSRGLCAQEFRARVIDVAEGDTITVLKPARSAEEDAQAIKIRLFGIDCPEKGQAHANKATQKCSELCLDKTITVRSRGMDRGRTLGVVILPDGKTLNHEMVRAGYAWWYRQYALGDAVLDRLEQEAKTAKRGLWADKDPVPPWEYRSQQRRAVDASTRDPSMGFPHKWLPHDWNGTTKKYYPISWRLFKTAATGRVWRIRNVGSTHRFARILAPSDTQYFHLHCYLKNAQVTWATDNTDDSHAQALDPATGRGYASTNKWVEWEIACTPDGTDILINGVQNKIRKFRSAKGARICISVARGDEIAVADLEIHDFPWDDAKVTKTSSPSGKFPKYLKDDAPKEARAKKPEKKRPKKEKAKRERRPKRAGFPANPLVRLYEAEGYKLIGTNRYDPKASGSVSVRAKAGSKETRVLFVRAGDMNTWEKHGPKTNQRYTARLWLRYRGGRSSGYIRFRVWITAFGSWFKKADLKIPVETLKKHKGKYWCYEASFVPGCLWIRYEIFAKNVAADYDCIEFVK